MTRHRRSVAVALLSAATLAYEVLLVRVFAIEQFHHFAYMAVGVAMLGFGAAGTLLATVGPVPRHTAGRWFAFAALAAVAALIASPALALTVSLDPTQIAWGLGQWLRLGLVYLLLALPFGLSATVVLLALALESHRPGRIYGASFLGSGIGALVATAGLVWFLPERALAIPVVLAACAALAAAVRGTGVPTSVAWVAIVVSLGVVVRPLWRLEVTPYKGLPQVEAFPDARRVAEHASPVGWVVAVEAPAFRYAPGLSLAYRGSLPPQTGIFVDGQLTGAFVDWGADSVDIDILDWLPSALPYSLGGRERVLVVGAGGGTEVWNAALHGAREVSAVELHPDVARLAATSERVLDADVEWVIGDARAFVARPGERFDLVTLGSGGGFGTTAAGVYALNEDFLHTVDAYAAYLDQLDPGGVLAVTRWLSIPPRESIRVILTAVEALRRTAPQAVANGLVVMRSWATATVLVKPSGFSSADVTALEEWTERRGFDIDWRPDLTSPVTRYHLIDDPVLFEAAATATIGRSEATEWARAYPFDVEPVDDARPYPHQFLRAGSIGAFMRGDRADWFPFAEWGYIALLATLLQSVVLAAGAILVPAALGVGSLRGGRLMAILGYFTAIGLAYLAAEIAAIQQLGLLLGHPVYAVTAVLVAFLTSSGLGSIWSDRIAAHRGWMLPLGIAVLLLVYSGAMLRLVHLLQPLPLTARAGFGMLAVAPLGFLMGTPFPLGLRALTAGDVPGTAWAWAANGFASVVAAPLAALIAVEAGSPIVLLVAGISYAMAAAVLFGGRLRVSVGSPPPLREAGA